MKAIVLEGPGVFGLREVEKPACPDKGLLLKVAYCGLCGSDLRTLAGGHRNIRLPAVLGHEVSGRIAELGKGYEGPYRLDDRLSVAPNVYCGTCEFCRAGRFEFCENLRELAQHWPGGFAEYMAIPEEALRLGTVSHTPDGLAPELAVIGEPASSCVNAQEKLGIGLGDEVLIIGSGPIGCIHICLARARGAKTIIVADIKRERLELCSPFGPDHMIDSGSQDLEAEVARVTQGRGPDVVITANPAGQTQIQAVSMIKKGGRIAFFGGLPHNNSVIPLDSNLVHYKGATIIGTTGFAPKHHRMALELMRQGKIMADKLVTHILPLEDFARGVSLAKEGRAMKVVYRVDG